MNVDESEWDNQERALASIRTGNPIGHEPRARQYQTLWKVLARQAIPALSDDFARRVALIADVRSDEIRRTDSRFEYSMASLMLATLALVAGLLSACFGTDWLRLLLAVNPWLKAYLVCLAVIAGSRGLYRVT
jgi:hypothetical protein